MILNELLTRQNVITKIELKDGEKELPKELKVKIMRIRLAYNKVKKAFDEDVKEFVEQIATDEYKALAQKTDRTEEEEAKYNELNVKINSDYIEFVNQKGLEEVKDTIDDKLTEDEYSEILDVNAGNDVEINGQTLKAADLMEAFYELFVA
jgi:REP element-mobilizing transposase RayT